MDGKDAAGDGEALPEHEREHVEAFRPEGHVGHGLAAAAAAALVAVPASPGSLAGSAAAATADPKPEVEADWLASVGKRFPPANMSTIQVSDRRPRPPRPGDVALSRRAARRTAARAAAQRAAVAELEEARERAEEMARKVAAAYAALEEKISKLTPTQLDAFQAERRLVLARHEVRPDPEDVDRAAYQQAEAMGADATLKDWRADAHYWTAAEADVEEVEAAYQRALAVGEEAAGPAAAREEAGGGEEGSRGQSASGGGRTRRRRTRRRRNSKKSKKRKSKKRKSKKRKSSRKS